MNAQLTVREACELTGKSESTIKRLIHEVVADNKHPDRDLISPSHKDLKARKAAKEPYIWKIDRDLLRQRYPEAAATGATDSKAAPTTSAASDILSDVLKKQLEAMDRQIRTLETQLDRKDEQITALNERMRESNVLMKELQQKVAIAAPMETTVREADANPVKEGTATQHSGRSSHQSIWTRPIRLFGSKR